MRFQVAVACLQGVLEAKGGIVGEVAPSIAVKESLRIADEFVRQWDGYTPPPTWIPTEEHLAALEFAMQKMSSYPKNRQVLNDLKQSLEKLCSSKSSSSEQKSPEGNSSK